MSAEDFKDKSFTEVIDDLPAEHDDAWRDEVIVAEQEATGGAPVNLSLVVEPGLEKKYAVDSLQRLSEYLNRESSSRYRAIILNAWTGTYDSPHFEVGLVKI